MYFVVITTVCGIFSALSAICYWGLYIVYNIIHFSTADWVTKGRLLCPSRPNANHYKVELIKTWHITQIIVVGPHFSKVLFFVLVLNYYRTALPLQTNIFFWICCSGWTRTEIEIYFNNITNSIPSTQNIVVK